MPVFDANTIANNLGITDTAQISYITRLLAVIEQYLAENGLYFYNTIDTGILNFQGYIYGRTIFTIDYLQTNPNPIVKIKEFGNSNSKSLVSNQDYMFSKHITKPNPIQVLELTEPISDKQYLEIEGLWGFCQDNQVPVDIIYGVEQLCLVMLNQYLREQDINKNGGKEIRAHSIGGISFSYNNTGQEQLTIENIVNSNFLIKSVLSKYLL